MIRIKNAKDIQAKLERYREVVQGKRGKMYPGLGEHLSRSISKTFDVYGRPHWPRRKGSYPWEMLQMTGRMKAHAEKTALGPWEIYQAIHLLQVFGLAYGQYQHYGTTSIDERPFVRPTEEERLNMMSFCSIEILRRTR